MQVAPNQCDSATGGKAVPESCARLKHAVPGQNNASGKGGDVRGKCRPGGTADAKACTRWDTMRRTCGLSPLLTAAL